MPIEEILAIIKILILFWGMILLTNIVNDISKAITNYSKLIKKKAELTKFKKYRYSNLGIKIDYTNQLIELITLLADIEVSSKIQSLQLIDTQYDVRNLDKDIEGICNRIFDGIKESAFGYSDTLFNDAFIIHEIYEIVSMTLMQKMSEHNNSIIRLKKGM